MNVPVAPGGSPVTLSDTGPFHPFSLVTSIGTSSVTVTQGQPFNPMVSVTSPGGTADIASF